MEETKIEKLGNYILDIAAGPFGSNLKVECFVPKGFPIIDGANLKGFKVTDNVSKFVTEEKARSLHRSIAKRNDVVVTISGNVGQISYIPEDSAFKEYLVSQRQFRVTFDTKRVFVPYLIYYFHTLEGQHKILSFANQTGVPALAQPLKNFKNIDIVLPSLVEQQRIASVLQSLDDKIEVNRRINDNLEQQAQALFNSWLVDFEPFKDGEFVESELGMIPKGWRVGTIGELIEIKYGKDHKKLSDGEIPVYGSGGLMRKCESALYKGESVLIPRKGTLNNVMYVNEAFWTVDTMFYSIPKIDNAVLFTYLYLCGKDLASMNSGSAVPSMTTEILNNMQIVIPTEMVMRDFNIKVTPVYNRIKHGNKESRRLAQLRDTLLPRLMSGELSVDGLKGQQAVRVNGACFKQNRPVGAKAKQYGTIVM